jgi:predicted dehydrogenase
MNAPLQVGVVGCGYWGPNLIRNLNALNGCDVKRICDQNTERLRRMAESYPRSQANTDFAQLVGDDDIDAIAIATPVGSHFDLARASLEAGKHTFVEKPLARSSRECRVLLALAEKRKLTLMVGHVFVFSAAVRRIQEIVQSGELGNIYYIGAQRLNLGLCQRDINVAWDLAPHDISIILKILGDQPISVNCQGKAHLNPDVEDVCAISLEFSDRRFAVIQCSWLDPNKVRRMTIVGSRKMIVYDDTEPIEKIKIYDKRVSAPRYYDTFGDFHYTYHYGDMCSPCLEQREPVRVECQHFLDCIRSGSRPESGGLEGLQVVEILEAATRSLRDGGARIPLPLPQIPVDSSDTRWPEQNGSSDIVVGASVARVEDEEYVVVADAAQSKRGTTCAEDTTTEEIEAL